MYVVSISTSKACTVLEDKSEQALHSTLLGLPRPCFMTVKEVFRVHEENCFREPSRGLGFGQLTQPSEPLLPCA